MAKFDSGSSTSAESSVSADAEVARLRLTTSWFGVGMGKNRRSRARRHGWGRGLTRSSLAVLALVAPAVTLAQGDQFGGQSRADAAQLLIVLGVQQAISSLPPSSGQAFAYEFDAEAETFVRSEVLGPISFHSTRTLGKGKLALGLAASYFELNDSFGPVRYLVEVDEALPDGSQPAGIVSFGLDVDAKVSLVNLTLSYGVWSRADVHLGVPVTVVDVKALQPFSTRQDLLDVPIEESRVSGVFQGFPLSADPTTRDMQIAGLVNQFEDRFDADCPFGPDICLTHRRETFADLGFDLDDGTHPGLGRVSIGAKILAYSGAWIRLALAPELFLPSPSQDEFAGPDSGAVLQRAIADVPISDWLTLHADVGYDCDFDSAELRRLLWNVGTSFTRDRLALDLGVGGSEYDVPIRWTPSTATGAQPPSSLTALGSNTVGDTFVDFLGGVRVRLNDRIVFGGAVTVPLNDQGFRPEALGTITLEMYL